MPKLIKNGMASHYEWQVLTDSNAVEMANLSQGRHLIPLQDWLTIENKNDSIGVFIDGDTSPEAITHAISSAPAIAIHFSAFADGRGFSLARILREDCEYAGELQATGNYIQDQLFYLKRCGFDAYVVPDESDIDSMLTSLNDFTDSYQASSDESRPLFRRR